MPPTLSLIRREFMAYFLSPIAYVVLAVFALVTGHLFYLALNLLTETGPHGVEFPMSVMLGDEKFWLVFLFIPPLLTMRLLAEEHGTGTLEMLMTAPIRDWQVVLAKYVACFLFYLLMWLPTLVYLPVLLDLKTSWNFTDWTPFKITLISGLVLASISSFCRAQCTRGSNLKVRALGRIINRHRFRHGIEPIAFWARNSDHSRRGVRRNNTLVFCLQLAWKSLFIPGIVDDGGHCGRNLWTLFRRSRGSNKLPSKIARFVQC